MRKFLFLLILISIPSYAIRANSSSYSVGTFTYGLQGMKGVGTAYQLTIMTPADRPVFQNTTGISYGAHIGFFPFPLNSAASTATSSVQSSPSGQPLGTLSIKFNSSCTGNLVTVTSGTNAVSEALVTVGNMYSGTIFSGTTGSNGQVMFSGKDLTVNVYASAPGYEPDSITVTLASFSECSHAVQNVTSPQANVTQNLTPPVNATTNATQNITTSAQNATPALSAPGSTPVNTSIIITTNCLACQIKITGPDGRPILLFPDSSGKVTFVPQLPGSYSIGLLQNGSIVQTLPLVAVALRSPPQTSVQPAPSGNFVLWGLLAAIALFIIYWWFEGKAKTKG